MPGRVKTESWDWRGAAGALCIGLAALGVAGMMFVGPGWTRPWHMSSLLAIGGLGLWLVRIDGTSRVAKPTGTQNPLLLLAGVFFTFGTLGPLILLVFENPPLPPQGGVVGVVIGGVIACGWASAFMFRRLWLIPVVIAFQVFVPARVFNGLHRLGAMENFLDLSEQSRRGVQAMLALACVVLGYVLMVMFVRRAEAAQSHAQAELAVAKQIHETLVPEVHHAEPGLSILGGSRASAEMGGDLVDLVRGEETIDVYLVDVSGHGVGAGIVMGMVKSAIRMRLRSQAPLASLLDDLNGVIADLVQPGMFATLACVRIDRAARPDGTRLVRYALAGHLPILHARTSSNAMLGAVLELPNNHLPLGIDRDERFTSGVIELGRGDILLMHTDGLSEVMDEKGRQLGTAAIRDQLASAAVSIDKNGTLMTAQDLAASIMMHAQAFGPQTDDQTVVVIRAE
jgi:serine phosphatase RsbU (regulator of sigma subunit)